MQEEWFQRNLNHLCMQLIHGFQPCSSQVFYIIPTQQYITAGHAQPCGLVGQMTAVHTIDGHSVSTRA